MDNLGESDVFMKSDRLSTLIDGIFAIAMTLLVLSIGVPHLSGQLSESLIQSSLITIISPFTSFVLSFILLAMFWTINHTLMYYIKYVDKGFLWITIIWLLFIVMVPFSTEFSGMYSKFIIPHLIINLNMLGVAFLLYLSVYYAYQKGLDRETIEEKKKNKLKQSCALFMVVSIIAVILSFITPQGSGMVYIILLVDKFLR
jgi:uncharacterized membrane protein